MPVNLSNASVSGSNQSVSVDRAERCFITKSLLYANEPIQWVTDPTRRKAEIEQILIDLGIVDDRFNLHGPSNTTNFDCVVHKSLMKYGFIAVTGTSETLKQLTKMVKEDNDKRQRHLDEQGAFLPRHLDLDNPTFLDPQYELVALHPEHLLPVDTVLIRYDPAQRTHKTYVPSSDRRLRESPGDLTCAPFPPFSGPDRKPGFRLNPFLIILNAANLFCQYYRLGSPSPLPPLPDDVLELVKQTTELSDLIYWKPEIEPGSYAENIELSCPTSWKGGAKTRRGVMSAETRDSDWARRYKESDLRTRLRMERDLERNAEDEEFLEALYSGKINEEHIPYPYRFSSLQPTA